MQQDKPSLTALTIARVISDMGKHRRYKHLLTPKQAEINRVFAKSLLKDSPRLKLISPVLKGAALRGFLDKFIIPGVSLHYALRKKFIREEFFKRDKQIEQFVVIGAGFDSFCLEFHRNYPEIKFFEIDHPATSSSKQKYIQRSRLQVAKNLVFIMSDLEKTSVKEALEAAGFVRDKRTFFVCEGVMMYLTKDGIQKLVNEVADIAATGSCFAVTMMDSFKSEKMNRHELVTDKVLNAQKEAFKTALSQHQMEEIFSSAGFKIMEVGKYHELQREHNRKAHNLKFARTESVYLFGK